RSNPAGTILKVRILPLYVMAPSPRISDRQLSASIIVIDRIIVPRDRSKVRPSQPPAIWRVKPENASLRALFSWAGVPCDEIDNGGGRAGFPDSAGGIGIFGIGILI